tara:strand:+ start:540 stop:1004 length:465 start_codon:yes stop_codon:yes gene_type:complete
MNYYEILNVRNDATLKEINKSYHELSIRFHPDKNPNDKYSEEKFKLISEAYSILSNYEKRIRYDNEINRNQFFENNIFGSNFQRLMNFNHIIDESKLLMNNQNSNSVSVTTTIENGIKKTKKITNNNGNVNIEEYEENIDTNKAPLLEKPFSFF